MTEPYPRWSGCCAVTSTRSFARLRMRTARPIFVQKRPSGSTSSTRRARGRSCCSRQDRCGSPTWYSSRRGGRLRGPWFPFLNGGNDFLLHHIESCCGFILDVGGVHSQGLLVLALQDPAGDDPVGGWQTSIRIARLYVLRGS